MQINDIKVIFLGRREMLPPDVLEAVESMERETSTHQTYVRIVSVPYSFCLFNVWNELYSAVLNVCCPYTSRDEVTTAVQQTVRDVESGKLCALYVFAQSHTRGGTLIPPITAQ